MKSPSATRTGAPSRRAALIHIPSLPSSTSRAANALPSGAQAHALRVLVGVCDVLAQSAPTDPRALNVPEAFRPLAEMTVFTTAQGQPIGATPNLRTAREEPFDRPRCCSSDPSRR